MTEWASADGWLFMIERGRGDWVEIESVARFALDRQRGYARPHLLRLELAPLTDQVMLGGFRPFGREHARAAAISGDRTRIARRHVLDSQWTVQRARVGSMISGSALMPTKINIGLRGWAKLVRLHRLTPR